MNKTFKKVFLYTLGVILVAFGISLHMKHNFGNGPYTQFNTILGEMFSIKIGTMMIIIGLLIICLYFSKKKNKDIFLSIMAIFLLGTVVNFFNDIVLYDFVINQNNIPLRIIVFFVAINIISVGVVLILKTKLSMLDMEMVTILLSETKTFEKMNFGQVRMILDATLIIVSIILSLLFISHFDITEYAATVAIFILGGPLVNLYLRLYDRIFLSKKI